MRIKPLGLFCAVVSLLGASVASASPIPVVDVTPVSQSVALGNALNVDVEIQNVTDLYGFQFDLSFGPTLLQATSVTEDGFLPSGGSTFFIPGTIDNVGGSVTFTADALIGAVSGVSGSGLLAQIGFTTVGAGTSSLDLSNVLLLDSAGNSIDAQLTGGSATVNPNGPAPSPVPEPASGLLLAGGLGALIRSRHARLKAKPL